MSLFTQLYPPKPSFTEKDLPNQTGKVFIVTGGNDGIGYQLSKILYSKGATVYIASRSKAKSEAAIVKIKESKPSTPGALKYLSLDLGDLTTIKPAATAFLAAETRLDVLFNNAGVSIPPKDFVEKDLPQSMRVNCVGPFLFAQLLTPLLLKTAKVAQPNSVRVIWTGSGIVETHAPPGGIDFKMLEDPKTDATMSYANSKAGNWLIASEMGKKVKDGGVISVVLNPGQLNTDGWNNAPFIARQIMKLTLHDPIYGAYTNIWAAFNTSITTADNGRYIIPWGRWHTKPRQDILGSLKSEKEGGTGLAEKFWTWLERQTRTFA